jgi:hypothetical protein
MVRILADGPSRAAEGVAVPAPLLRVCLGRWRRCPSRAAPPATPPAPQAGVRWAVPSVVAELGGVVPVPKGGGLTDPPRHRRGIPRRQPAPVPHSAHALLGCGKPAGPRLGSKGRAPADCPGSFRSSSHEGVASTSTFASTTTTPSHMALLRLVLLSRRSNQLRKSGLRDSYRGGGWRRAR